MNESDVSLIDAHILVKAKNNYNNNTVDSHNMQRNSNNNPVGVTAKSVTHGKSMTALFVTVPDL